MMKHTVGFVLTLLLAHVNAAIANKDVAADYFPTVSTSEQGTYQDWLDAKFDSSYSQHVYMTSSVADIGVAVFWEITGEDIQFAVALRASGWIAFGLSEVGGMFGADVVYWESSNPTEIVDSHIVASRAAPIVDDCQNWDFVDVTAENGWIILEVKRPLDTGDLQDRVIHNDSPVWMAPSKLIAAWGEESTLGYHFQRTARSSVRLFASSDSGSNALEATLEGMSDGTFTVAQSNFGEYKIPARDTTYKEICLTYADIQEQTGTNKVPLTLVGATPIIAEEIRPYLHHFTVYVQPDCGFSFARSMLYVWAPGHEGLTLPDDVGFPLFDSNNRKAIYIQIHYNNPSSVSGVMDSTSGVKFYYTETERAQEAGILELGDPLVMLNGESVGNGLSKHEFSCPGLCSSVFLQQTQVTVLWESLHMHQTGVRMTNQVIRNDEVIRSSWVDVFDFDEQGGFHVPQEPFTVMPGDAFRTTCYYEDGGVFGLSSQEEMCIAYLLYYPAISNFGSTWVCPFGLETGPCSQEYDSRGLSSATELERVFGSAGSTCPAAPSTPATPTSEPTNAPVVSPTKSPMAPTTDTSQPILDPTTSPPPTSNPTKLNLPTNANETPTQVDGDTAAPSPAADSSAMKNARVAMMLWIGILSLMVVLF